MQSNSPFRAAYGVAMLRAAHQIADFPLVLDDPLAIPIVGAKSASDMRTHCDLRWLESSRPVRAFIVARSRYTEDGLAAAIEEGVRQYVILGAGLDTYAYRQERYPAAMRVFEVDHPRTQTWKRQCLRTAGIAAPDSLRYVPVDFARESLPDGLARAGFRMGEPAFFSFLGVAIFLDEATVMAILGFVASLPRGSQIVMDYGIPSAQLNDEQRRERAAGASQAVRTGEPWRTFLDTARLTSDLYGMGFVRTENLAPQDVNERYLGGRADGLQVAAGGRRIMRARR
ncbi:MAG: class I SAM-dependent methyltransferase [Burkholderiales bacterium]|nr:class I SAM-dependent methyltransferase [Burkholderiales bacterium]